MDEKEIIEAAREAGTSLWKFARIIEAKTLEKAAEAVNMRAYDVTPTEAIRALGEKK